MLSQGLSTKMEIAFFDFFQFCVTFNQPNAGREKKNELRKLTLQKSPKNILAQVV